MYFRNCGLRKTWLDKCLKSAVEDHPLKNNMVNGAKHVSNLISGTSTMSIDHCKDN